MEFGRRADARETDVVDPVCEAGLVSTQERKEI
jgi:hypothetical protein